jgi:hypothetical protein
MISPGKLAKAASLALALAFLPASAQAASVKASLVKAPLIQESQAPQASKAPSTPVPTIQAQRQSARGDSFILADVSQGYFKARALSAREEGLEIKGELPVARDMAMGELINERIQDAYKEKVASAKESKARTITFAFRQEESRGIVSLLLYSTTSTATARQEVDSFNFTSDGLSLVDVNDILSPNGLQLATKIISARVKNNPDRFYPNFPGVMETDAFAVIGGDLVFLFDAFHMAPGSEGIISFPISLDSVVNYTVKKSPGYFVKEQYSLKMVPLRNICGALGYSVAWNSAGKAITVEWPGEIAVMMSLDKNDYTLSRQPAADKTTSRALESAPELKDGITYVPISFFDQILDRVAFSVDESDNIVFSCYTGEIK